MHTKKMRLAMRRNPVWMFLPLLLSLHSEAQAAQPCAATVSELGAMLGK
ncbi:MAG: hypothetical protein ACYCY9_13230 [Thiobacillus sp.]